MSGLWDKYFPEASQEHLLGIIFHHILRKVKGQGLIGSIYHATNRGNYPENTLTLMGSQGEFGPPDHAFISRPKLLIWV